MDVKIKTAIFRPLYLISPLLFLDHFKTAYDSNSIQEGAVICSFHHVIRESDKAALLHQVTAVNKKDHQKEVKLTIFWEVVNYLLATYAIDSVIVEAEVESVNFRQPAMMTAVCYSKVLCEKARPTDQD